MSKQALSYYVGERVRGVGDYQGSDHFTNHDKSGSARNNKVATLINVSVQTDKETIYIGHCHVQYAGRIWDEKPRVGDRVEFTAEVHRYKGKGLDGNMVDKYGLSAPSDVTVTTPAAAIPEPVYREEPPEVESEEAAAGRVDKRAVTVDAIKELGPLASYQCIAELVYNKYGFRPSRGTITNAKNDLGVAKTFNYEKEEPPVNAVSIATPPPSVLPPPLDIVEVFKSVRQLRQDCGNSKLAEVVALVDRVNTIANMVGGRDKLLQLAQLMD